MYKHRKVHSGGISQCINREGDCFACNDPKISITAPLFLAEVVSRSSSGSTHTHTATHTSKNSPAKLSHWDLQAARIRPWRAFLGSHVAGASADEAFYNVLQLFRCKSALSLQVGLLGTEGLVQSTLSSQSLESVGIANSRAASVLNCWLLARKLQQAAVKAPNRSNSITAARRNIVAQGQRQAFARTAFGGPA